MMTLTVKCHIDRDHLVWAVAYLRGFRRGRVVNDQIFKSDVLKFLREQLSMFGSDHCFGESWREDLEDDLPYAEAWVNKRFGRSTT